MAAPKEVIGAAVPQRLNRRCSLLKGNKVDGRRIASVCLRQNEFFLPVTLPPPLPLCLSVLCAVPTVVITRRTDAGLWAMRHFSQTYTFALKHSPHVTSLTHNALFWKMPPCQDRALARFIFFIKLSASGELFSC